MGSLLGKLLVKSSLLGKMSKGIHYLGKLFIEKFIIREMICGSIIREIISSESIIKKNEYGNPLFRGIISKVIHYF